MKRRRRRRSGGERPGALLRDEQPPQDLARGRGGDRVDERQLARALVRRHARRDMGEDLRGGGPAGRHHHRLRALAGPVVGDRDHGGVRHRGVGPQHGLDLGRGDLQALDLDELLEPVLDVHVPSGVDAGEVARAQPPVGVDRRGGGRGVAEVAGHQLRAPDPQLAGAVGGQVLARHDVDDPGLHARQQDPARAGRDRRGRVDQRDRGDGLGHPVALADGGADASRALLLEIGRQRRGAAADEAQGGEVVAVHRGVAGHRQRDRRHHHRDREPVGLDEPEVGLEVEAGQRDDRAARPQGHARDDVEPDGVEERRDGHRPVVGGLRERDLHLRDVGDDRPVGEHHALGQARRARRVGKQGEVAPRVDQRARRPRPLVARGEDRGPLRLAVRDAEHDDLDRPVPQRPRRADQGQERRDREHPPGAAVAELGGDLLGRVQRVDAGDDAAGVHRPEAADEPLGHVRRDDREDVPADEPAPCQTPRAPVHVAAQVAVGQGAARRAVDHRRRVGAGRRVVEQVLGHADVGHLDGGPPAAVDAFDVVGGRCAWRRHRCLRAGRSRRNPSSRPAPAPAGRRGGTPRIGRPD